MRMFGVLSSISLVVPLPQSQFWLFCLKALSFHQAMRPMVLLTKAFHVKRIVFPLPPP